jgi:hypothetical protein
MSQRLVRKVAAVASGVAVFLGTVAAAGTRPADATETPSWFEPSALTVRGSTFVDDSGREVVLRGFNVSGTVKLSEHGGLPFENVADAHRSAVAMRRLTGANSVRFLLSWAYAEPKPGQLDEAYLRKVTEQLGVFLDQGFYVLLDYHQDLYSRYLFNSGSWYTGDGAPQWVVTAGNYPKEFCGVCVQWGQNIKQNEAFRGAISDFWHNRVLQTQAGSIGVQDAFLRHAQGSLLYIREHLGAQQFGRVLGVDPFNEPYAGRYDNGQSSEAWERDLLMPFHRRFRQRMDSAGWADKPAFIEPNMFWDANLGFMKEPGGFVNVGEFGPRYVFNTHFYDQKALSGVFMWGKAKDGQYTQNFGTVRERATTLRTAAVVSEFGSPMSGNTSDKTPTVLKGMYQALDSAVSGADWWKSAPRSASVLSSMQWQWDLYNGRHHEPMNGNPDKIQTTADAWNSEDFSVVNQDQAGDLQLRADARVLDRVYPAAVSGHTLAFTYEDRSRDGSTTLTWNPVPATMPNLARLVGDGQYAVLVWRSAGSDAPTELQLPSSFPPSSTTVISDLETRIGLPVYVAPGGEPAHALAVRNQRLVLSAPTAEGWIHYGFVTNGSQAAPAEVRAAAQQELARWIADTGFGAADNRRPPLWGS